jgi:hypothetical protein
MLRWLLCVSLYQTQAMQRRHFPSILLYGFGLALALSLVLNGFLLYDQIRQRSRHETGLLNPNYLVYARTLQQQLLDYKRSLQQKDSLIRRLEQVSNAPPDQRCTTLRTASK